MKKVKQIMSSFLVIVSLLCISTVTIFAVESNEMNGLGDESEEQKVKNDKNVEDFFNDIEIQNIQPLGSGVSAGNVPYFKQEENYYCGAASTKMALHTINGWSESQKEYARVLLTNPNNGTGVARLALVLNANQSRKTYSYHYIGIGTSLSTFRSLASSSMWHQAPPVINVYTNGLYLYNGTMLHHYVVGQYLATYSDNTPYDKMGYVDPWDMNYGRGETGGHHQDSVYNFHESTIYKYIIVGKSK